MLLIDRKFSHDEHCLRVVKRFSRFINFIFRNFKTRNVKLPLRFYKCYAQLLLDCQLCFSTALKNIKRIQSIQVHFTRRLCDARPSYLSCVDRLKLDTLAKRRLKLELISLFRLVHEFL